MRVFCASLAAVTLMAGALQVPAELANGLKAVVHDSVVTYEDVATRTDPAVELLRRNYRNQPELFQQEIDKAVKENLEELINRQLILHDFNTTPGYHLPESVVDELVEEKIHESYIDRRKLIKTLNAEGTTYEQFRQRVRDDFIIRALRSKNVSQEIIVSPHKVEAYYQAHREEFKAEEEVKLRLITLSQSSEPSAPSAQKMAEEIYAKLKGGATFGEMAALYSQTQQEGQWYEWPQLTRHLADIASTLQPGQHSRVLSRSVGSDYWVCQYEAGQPTQGRHYKTDPKTMKEVLAEEQRFETASAATNLPPAQEFFLVLLEDKHPAHYKPLSEVRAKIEEEFVLQERARLEKQWMERLKKKTFVRVFPGG